MKIRQSTDTDTAAIHDLHLNAFGEEEAAVVAQLAVDLMQDKTAQPALSLVAVDQDEIVGHILFTTVTVSGSSIENAYILCPLAVASKLQRSGVGTALIQEGLDILKGREASFVMVLGDPNYYSRAGFNADHKISPPYEIAYPEAWLAQELKDGALNGLKGTIQCADALHSPALW